MDGTKEINDAKLTYDLRQRRAKLIADCIDDVVEAAKAENYYAWLKNIDDLYSVSKHTFKDKEKASNDFEQTRKGIVTLANTYSSTWLGNSKEQQACAKIEESLRKLFEKVMDWLEESGVFGTSTEDGDDL